MALEAAVPWGVLQILGKGADRLRTKQHLLELPELRKTKFEVYAMPEQCWWVNPSFGLTSRRSLPRDKGKQSSLVPSGTAASLECSSKLKIVLK